MVNEMIGIIKGDIRYEYLSNMLENTILTNDLLQLINIDELLLPIGGISDDYIIKSTNINILDVIKQNSIKKIYSFNTNKRLEDLCHKYLINLVMINDLDYIKYNSKLTAKGIMNYMGYDDSDISDYKVLIVGYGNIAYYLCKLLDVYEVNYKVYTINELEKKYIRLNEINIEDNLVGTNYDVIINTIPSNLEWNYETLTNCKIIDVSSEPYGFDIVKLNDMKINYQILSRVPSRYCPKSAAKIIKRYIK